jgi:hypothetical protein
MQEALKAEADAKVAASSGDIPSEAKAEEKEETKEIYPDPK